MTLILKNTDQLEFQTNLSEVIQPFKNEFKSLHWILTDQEYILLDHPEKGAVDKLNHESEIIRFDGSVLFEILENRKIQFVWGVLCGTKERVHNLSPANIPYVNHNKMIWNHPEKFLLPESEIEIICFDSSCTIIKFKEPELEKRWKMKFTDAKELKN